MDVLSKVKCPRIAFLRKFELIGILVVHGWQVGNHLFVSFAQVPTLAKYLLVFSHLSLMSYISPFLSFMPLLLPLTRTTFHKLVNQAQNKTS